MQKLINVLDKDILQDNIKFAALFIMNFECLKEFVIARMKDFFTDEFEVIDGKFIPTVSNEYQTKLKQLDKNGNKLHASIQWFKELGAISGEDVELFYRLRDKRSYITHEFTMAVAQGFTEEELSMFNEMVKLYGKIDRWWINEVEIVTDLKIDPNGYDHEGVMGNQAIFLSLINDVAFGNDKAYSELLELLKKEIDASKMTERKSE